MNWRELFRYDPETGKLFWKVTRSNRAVIGAEVGTFDKDGYRVVVIGGKGYKVHRIIWDMIHPECLVTSKEQIDHINHIRDDNRAENLRKVNCRENRRNVSVTPVNTSGVIGVGWRKDRNLWRAYITVDKTQISLGSFTKFEDAVSARKAAEIAYGFHENHGLTNDEIKAKESDKI